VLAAVNQYLLPASRLWQMTISGTDGQMDTLHCMLCGQHQKETGLNLF